MRCDDIQQAKQVPFDISDRKLHMPTHKPIDQMTIAELKPALVCCARSQGRPEVCRTCMSCTHGRQIVKIIRNGGGDP